MEVLLEFHYGYIIEKQRQKIERLENQLKQSRRMRQVWMRSEHQAREIIRRVPNPPLLDDPQFSTVAASEEVEG